jgi:hypothetical protein
VDFDTSDIVSLSCATSLLACICMLLLLFFCNAFVF